MEMGGSEQSSSSSQGFRDLPPEIQNAFKALATSAQGMIGTNTGAYQANGFQGFAPTQSSLNADIAMQQNPFDKYVIDEINRQSQGANSVLQQNLSAAGQFGSNRQALGANDIDLSRQNQIGGFKQQQFNTSLENALTKLPGLRGQDMGFQLQQQQAPVNALKDISAILGVLPTNSGQSQGSGSGFNFGLQW